MNNSEHLLSCLAEECCEIGQRVSKALRFGLEEVQPGQNQSNAQRIVGEFMDLLAVMQMLDNMGILVKPSDAEARALIEAKQAKVRKFMDYARLQGALHDPLPTPGVRHHA